MRKFALIGVVCFLALPGCSVLVRGLVDSQPRVTVADEAYGDPAKIVKGDVVVYAPAGDAGLDADIVKQAPVIVQGVRSSAPDSAGYDPKADELGSPHVTADGKGVRIDTAEPRVFARVEHAEVNGVELKQLVYAFWYPNHPIGTVESGSVDGGVLRVTLDTTGEPAVFEYTQPCGCFHGVFVSEPVEAAALGQYQKTARRRAHAVEPPLKGHDDWVVRGVVSGPSSGRITLYLAAGKHSCEAICMRSADAEVPGASARRTYAVAPYESLERVASDAGGTASMFDSKGLVLGGQRGMEQLVMGDLDHAGWPRRLDVMLIHWDADKWSDPTLLATHLRLPGMVTGSSVVAAGTAADDADERAGAAVVPVEDMHGRRLVLFTNGHCRGCQETKKYMANSQSVREAMKGWECRVVDTLTPEGAELAAAAGVTSVPVLVGYNEGREVFRAEDVDSPEKIVVAISQQE